MKEFNLIDSNPESILADALRFHEEITGERLELCTKEAYLYSTVAALLANIKANMNDVAKQNFLKYSREERLDLKGNFYGERGIRLKANKARTTIRCHISSVVAKDVIIAKGTRFLYKNYMFYTEQEYKIKQGDTYVDVIAVAEIAGELGKILAGDIKEIVDRYEYIKEITNITDVTGGREEENDDEYRKRLELIPESFTTGGSEGSYEYWVKKSSNLVTDVFINSPKPNYIDIYVVNGLEHISLEEKQKIKNYIIENKNIKVLNDQLEIKDPIFHNYNIDLDYWVYDNSLVSKSEIEKELRSSLEQYTKSFKMGESINLQDIIDISKNVEGIRRVEIKSPQTYTGQKFHLAKCGTITISYKGAESR